MSGLDFDRLSKTSASDTATEPRRIFSALPGKDATKYPYPRAGQTEVWERWHQRRTDPDLVVKMNTGSGKTVVGLLILKSSMNEGVGPVAYVSPDKYLADQVRQAASELGLETTDDPFSSRFQQSKAILVVNVYKLVNGLSQFGVTGGRRAPIELGTVLVDDAHVCVSVVEEQFALRVPKDHATYQELLTLFKDDLAGQSGPATQDLIEGFGYAALQIPFWAWAERQQKVVEILHAHRSDEEFKYTWPLVSECLSISRAAITTDEIEVKPSCLPMHRVPSFAEAKRRIYMTATLADDSVLVTHFNADPKSISTSIIAKAADDLGDRMILTPLETHPGTRADQIQAFLRNQAERHNVVVIVPSRRRAEAWQTVADLTLDSSTIHAGVQALQAGHVGLVVLINKYDGVDLPGNACRILALDGLPEAYGALDRVDAIAFADSEAMLGRQVQRIEQGMGRGVRSSDDFCVVMLLGSRLTQRLNSAGGYARFSPATKAQIALSRRVADLLHGAPFESLGAVVDQCLTRDTGWLRASRDALDGVSHEAAAQVTPHALAQREAFDLAEQRRYREAVATLQRSFDAGGDLRLRGWLKQQAAAYLHWADAAAAQQLQTAAQSDSRALLKPRGGVGYTRLTGASNQAQRSVSTLRQYDTGIAFRLGIEALLDDLLPDPDQSAVEPFEQAVHDLGLHLGFEAQRPERDTGQGPDVLWKLGSLEFLVIECKSAVTTDFVAKKDAAQLGQSIDWFKDRYDSTCKVAPLMVHKAARLHGLATAREGMRVMTFDRLGILKAAVRRFAEALEVDGFSDPSKVEQQIVDLKLSGKGFVENWSESPHRT